MLVLLFACSGEKQAETQTEETQAVEAQEGEAMEGEAMEGEAMEGEMVADTVVDPVCGMEINKEDNLTALAIAEAEIESGERVAVSTGTGIDPSG